MSQLTHSHHTQGVSLLTLIIHRESAQSTVTSLTGTDLLGTNTVVTLY